MVKGQVEGFRCDRRRRGRPGDAKATGDSKHQLAQAACLHSGCHVDRLIKQCYSLQFRFKKVFIFLYSYQPREGSVHSHGTIVSRVLSTEHNKSAVFQSHLHFNLSALIHPKGPSLSKKNKKRFDFFKGILESFSTHGYKYYLGKFFHEFFN